MARWEAKKGELKDGQLHQVKQAAKPRTQQVVAVMSPVALALCAHETLEKQTL